MCSYVEYAVWCSLIFFIFIYSSPCWANLRDKYTLFISKLLEAIQKMQKLTNIHLLPWSSLDLLGELMALLQTFIDLEGLREIATVPKMKSRGL